MPGGAEGFFGRVCANQPQLFGLAVGNNGQADCTHYNILSEGSNVFLNAPTGSIYLRVGNNTVATVGSSAIFVGAGGGNIAADTSTMYVRGTSLTAFQDYWGTTNWAEVTPSGVWAWGFNNWSDQRLKKNIQPLDQGLALVKQLRPVRYQFRAGAERTVGKALSLPTNPQIGLIAQEVQAVLPGAVSADKDGVYGINEAQLVPVLIQAVKEQQAEIEQMRTEIAALKAGR